MEYCKLKETFRELKRNTPTKDLTAHIVFTEDSFNRPYPLISRSYAVTSNNKAFYSHMGGYSSFAYGLDGSDQGKPSRKSLYKWRQERQKPTFPPIQFYSFIKSLSVGFPHIRFSRFYRLPPSGSSTHSDQWSSSELLNRLFCRW